jgi:hypothetical protein
MFGPWRSKIIEKDAAAGRVGVKEDRLVANRATGVRVDVAGKPRSNPMSLEKVRGVASRKQALDRTPA